MAPPPGSKPGDVVEVAGITRAPDAPFLNPKKKIFEAVAPDLQVCTLFDGIPQLCLQVNSSKQATYKGVLWTVNGSPVTSQSLVSVNIKWGHLTVNCCHWEKTINIETIKLYHVDFT